MVAVRSTSKPEPPEEDSKIFLHDIAWKDFERMLAIRGDAAGVRIHYLDGTLELVSPSNIHETRKKALARLLELWAIETDVPLEGIGSWTLKDKSTKAGGEPDECYVLSGAGAVPALARTRPDLVLEIEWTDGGLAKREVYRRLGVGELWTLRRDCTLVVCTLEGRGAKTRYVERPDSKLLPTLDVAWLLRFLVPESQFAALKALRDELRKKPRKKPRKPRR